MRTSKEIPLKKSRKNPEEVLVRVPGENNEEIPGEILGGAPEIILEESPWEYWEKPMKKLGESSEEYLIS